MDTDKPRMFRRRTDKIYATLQQVQRRITQGTEPGEKPGPETVYTSGASSYPGASSRPAQPLGMGRTISQAQANSGQGYLVTPDGRRISAEPDTASQATATPTSQPPASPSQTPEARSGSTAPPVHPMERALQQWDKRVEEPAPPAPMLPPHQAEPHQDHPQASPSQPAHQGPAQGYAQPSGPESHQGHGAEARPNPALQMAASTRSRPRRIELGIELATVLAIAWLGTVAVAFFLGRQEFTGGGFDSEVVSAAGTQVQGSEQTTPPPGQGNDQPPVSLAGNGTDILVLSSVDPYNRQAEERFQALADRFNQAAREGNFDPLFAVRQPRSGGLQFVYGKVGTGFGIRRDDQRGKNITAALKDKFPGMKWLSLD